MDIQNTQTSKHTSGHPNILTDIWTYSKTCPNNLPVQEANILRLHLHIYVRSLFCIFKANFPTPKGTGKPVRGSQDHSQNKSILDIPTRGPGQGTVYIYIYIYIYICQFLLHTEMEGKKPTKVPKRTPKLLTKLFLI